MTAASHPGPALSALLLLVFAGPVPAGPVQGAEADGMGTAPTTVWPEASVVGAQPLEVVPNPAAHAASANADATPSTSALAAEILKEAEAGAQAAEPARSRQVGSTQGASDAAVPRTSDRSAYGADEDFQELRETGKAALAWIKDAVPWLRSDSDEVSADRANGLDAVEWSVSSWAGNPSDTSPHALSARLAGSARATQQERTLANGDATNSPAEVADHDQNIVRLMINIIQEVLLHPMTWLAVCLVAIGGIVVKRIDRRPTK